MHRGNHTGYLVSAINWNCRRGFIGGLNLFYRYFNLKTDTYYGARIGLMDAKKKHENTKNHLKRVKIKVFNFLSEAYHM